MDCPRFYPLGNVGCAQYCPPVIVELDDIVVFDSPLFSINRINAYRQVAVAIFDDAVSRYFSQLPLQI